MMQVKIIVLSARLLIFKLLSTAVNARSWKCCAIRVLEGHGAAMTALSWGGSIQRSFS
jgi:hypothetical protein